MQYVYDSISRRLLGEQFDEFLVTEDIFGNPLDPPMLNWEPKIDMKNSDYVDILNALYNPPVKGLPKSLDVSKMIYEYTRIDYNRAVGKSLRYHSSTQSDSVVDNGGMPEVIFEATLIYPDTLVWLRDFDYSYNDPLAFRYFSHPAYDVFSNLGRFR